MEAKTKNSETPMDICEDPELKERIAQLKNEMETKRNSSHSNRLKRSHSSNTRTQSVRRTSIREKSQISRREAKLEAKMRSQGSNGVDGCNAGINDTDTDTDGGGNVVDSRTSAMPDLVKSTSGSLSKGDRISNENASSKGNSTVIDVNGAQSSSDADPSLLRSSEKDHLPPSSAARPASSTSSSASSSAKVSSSNYHPESTSSLTQLSTTINSSSNNKNHSSTVVDCSRVIESRSTDSRLVENRSSDSRKKSSVIKNPGYSDRDIDKSDSSSNLLTDNSSNPVNNNISSDNSNLVSSREDRKSSGESVKVEIHVTVNTGSSPTSSIGHPITGQSIATGTLADLKKQRTESRSNRNSVINGDVVDSPSENTDGGTTANGNNSTTVRTRYVVDAPTVVTTTTAPKTMLPQPPPSPSRPNIFRGDPSEVVGGNNGNHKQGCCIIS